MSKKFFPIPNHSNSLQRGKKIKNFSLFSMEFSRGLFSLLFFNKKWCIPSSMAPKKISNNASLDKSHYMY